MQLAPRSQPRRLVVRLVAEPVWSFVRRLNGLLAGLVFEKAGFRVGGWAG